MRHISRYSRLSSFLVMDNVSGGGSSSYVWKQLEEMGTSKGVSSSLGMELGVDDLAVDNGRGRTIFGMEGSPEITLRDMS